MGDKNRVASAVTGSDLQVKVGHGILKAIYTAQTGDDNWVVRDGTGAVAATACVTFACAIVGDTITLNGLLYTGVCGAEACCGDFTITACMDATTALAFTVAVNCDCRMPACATICTHDITACDTCAVVNLVSDVIGQIGNGISLTTTAMCCTISLSTTTGFLACGTGDAMFTIDLVAAVNGPLCYPYLNTPFNEGLFMDVGAGAAGGLTIIFE